MKTNEEIQARPVGDLICKAAYSTPVLRLFGSVGKLTLGGSGTQCDNANNIGTQNTACKPSGSDPSIKENIARVGTHPMGFDLYLFDYKSQYREVWGHGRQFGVMADEVELIMPKAVVVHPDGYKMVHYDMLGIDRTVH